MAPHAPRRARRRRPVLGGALGARGRGGPALGGERRLERRNLRVSLVLVAHRSSAHLPGAVESFRREAAAAGVTAEVVVVEQSEDEAERERAAACRPDRLLPRPNCGYAAGVNAGIEATSGDPLLVGNPDLEFAPGSVAPLLAALDSGWSVAGPQFFLGDFLLPPADEQTPGQELLRRCAWRSEGARRRRFRREVRRCLKAWDAREPLAVPNLSGALLAFRRRVYARIGAWDEGFFLYFEETDWLRRARRIGLRAALVPGSRVRHAWGHAARPAAFEETFARSARHYYGKHFPLTGAWAARPAARRPPSLPLLAPGEAPAPGGEVLWLVSPSPLGLPAAGVRGTGSPVAAVERFLAEASHATPLVLSACDPASGRLQGSWRWPRDPTRGH